MDLEIPMEYAVYGARENLLQERCLFLQLQVEIGAAEKSGSNSFFMELDIWQPGQMVCGAESLKVEWHCSQMSMHKARRIRLRWIH